MDHVAFAVRDLGAVLARVRAAGHPIVTRAELPPTSAAKDETGVFVMGPDDILIELVEAKDLKANIAMDHIHFAAPQVAAMEAWYVRLLGASLGTRGSVAESSVPGSRLIFAPAATPVTGTKGRVLDHIGFEVRNLEAFAKDLEGMGVKIDRFIKTKIAGIGDHVVVYLTDPWGTYVELTEGLDKVR